MEKERQTICVSAQVPRQLEKDFRILAATKGVSKSALLRALLRQAVSGRPIQAQAQGGGGDDGQ